MNPYVYNGSLGVGLVLIGVGTGLWSIPAGLLVSGAVLIGLTVYGAELTRRGRR